MEESTSILWKILDYAWMVFIAVIAHLYKKQSDLDDQFAEHEKSAERELGVIESRVNNLTDTLAKIDERNEETHSRIVQKIDRHHETIMAQLLKILDRVNNRD